MRIERFDWDGRDARGLAGEIRDAPAGARRGRATRRRRSSTRSRRAGTGAARDRGAVRRRTSTRPRCASRTSADRAAAVPARPRAAAARSRRRPRTSARSPRRSWPTTESSSSRRGRRSQSARGPGRLRRASTRPAGRRSYPSTALMCCIPAKVAGVERVVLVTPHRAGRRVSGHDSWRPRRSPAPTRSTRWAAPRRSPRSRWEPRAIEPGRRDRRARATATSRRRSASWSARSGSTGSPGPSELMVIAGDTADAGWIALDLCAQAEHGADGLLVAAAVETVILDAIQDRGRARSPSERGDRGRGTARAGRRARHRGGGRAGQRARPRAPGARHRGRRAARRASHAPRAASSSGEGGATAFGDYAAGSNHVLPTGGAGRFQGPLGPGRLQAPDRDRRDRAGGRPGARPGGRYAGARRGLPAARRVRRGEGEGARE